MRAIYSFEFLELDDGLVAVPVGVGADQFSGVLKVNESAIVILKMLENDTTEEKILENVLMEYTGEKGQLMDYIHDFIGVLVKEGIVK